MRIRVEGTRLQRRRDLDSLQQHCDGRVGCSVDHRTGSALLTYDPEELDAESVIELAREAGGVFETLETPGIHRLVQQPISEAANGVLQRFRKANRAVLVATRGRVDLRMMMPVALTGLAVRQLMRNGVGVRDAPWYVLAYYAFDSYIKLHADDMRQAQL